MHRIKDLFFPCNNLKARNMVFVLLSSWFCSSSNLTWLLQVSVSKIYCAMLFDRVSTSGEISLSLNVSHASRSSLRSREGFLEYVLWTNIKSGVVLLSKLSTDHLKHNKVHEMISTQSLWVLPVCYRFCQQLDLLILFFWSD